MKTQSISWFSFLLTLKFLILFQAPTGSTQPNQQYKACSSSFSCGNITDIGYPFRGSRDPPYCGHPSLVLSCDDQTNITNINIMTTEFRVLEIDETTQTMRVSREDMMEGSRCPTEIANTTLDFTLFDYAAAYKNYTFLYGCDPFLKINGSLHVSCGDNINGWYDKSAFVILGGYGPGVACKGSVVVPAPPVEAEIGGFENVSRMDVGVFREGFLIRWKIGGQQCSDCSASGGRCGYDMEMNQTTCYCADPPYVSDRCVVTTAISEAKKPAVHQYTWRVLVNEAQDGA